MMSASCTPQTVLTSSPAWAKCLLFTWYIDPQIKTVDVEFNKLLVNTTISGASYEAARATSGVKKLAAKQVIYTFLESLYVHVQCTPDLSTSDCK
jgi:hypothetical protein